MFGNEYLSTVFRREHATGVKPQAQGGRVGGQFPCRWMKFSFRCLVAEYGVGDIFSVKEGEPEMPACRRGVVQLVRGKIVPQPVPAVVGEPQFAGLRVPVKPHGISHALGEHLEARAVRIHAHDGGKAAILLPADIAGSPHGNIEFFIGTETDKFPPVMAMGGKAVVHHGIGGAGRQVVDNVIEPDDPVNLRHKKVAVLEGHTVGHAQPLGQDDRPVYLEIPVAIHECVHPAGLSRSHD